jgi:hypothetical protein
VPGFLAVFGGQEGLNHVPGHRLPNGPTTHADDVHVIVFQACLAEK